MCETLQTRHTSKSLSIFEYSTWMVTSNCTNTSSLCLSLCSHCLLLTMLLLISLSLSPSLPSSFYQPLPSLLSLPLVLPSTNNSLHTFCMPWSILDPSTAPTSPTTLWSIHSFLQLSLLHTDSDRRLKGSPGTSQPAAHEHSLFTSMSAQHWAKKNIKLILFKFLKFMSSLNIFTTLYIHSETLEIYEKTML